MKVASKSFIGIALSFIVIHTISFADTKAKTKNITDYVYTNGIKPVGNTIHQIATITATMVNNWVNPMHPTYCQLPNNATTLAMQQRDAQETADLIKKYSPILYLEKNEAYFPISVQNYIRAPGTSLVNSSGQVLVAQGQVTMENLYTISNQYVAQHGKDDIYLAIAQSTTYGSDPANNKDAQQNLITPIYVVTYEEGNFLYIQYLTFYGANGPYSFGPLQGNVLEIQNYHEADLEHVTLELDKNTKQLKRIYYSSHGRNEGFWLDAQNPDVQYEGSHPVVYVAHYSHGMYPQAGTYVRIYGLANDITNKGQRWSPELLQIYAPSDPKFNVSTMGWVDAKGSMGAHGVSYPTKQPWFLNSTGRSAIPGQEQGGDIGRPYEPQNWFCSNPPERSNSWSDYFKIPIDKLKYAACIASKIPYATIPS